MSGPNGIRWTLGLIFVLSMSLVGISQENKLSNPMPDFSGTWDLDKSKSGPERGYGMQFALDITIVIVQKELAMSMEETHTSRAGSNVIKKEIVADGRKVAYRKKLDNDNYISYHWDGKKLIKKAVFVIAEGEGWDSVLKREKKHSMKIENREEWTISKDGKTLANRVIGGVVPGIPDPGPFKYIYKRRI